jgi:hypothetical protein
MATDWQPPSHWWWGYSSHRRSRTFIQSLVGDIHPIVGRGIRPIVGRGYLSPTHLSAEISPPHHRTSQPPRAKQDECPERCFDGDTYPHRTARWSGIFILSLVGDTHPIVGQGYLSHRWSGIFIPDPPFRGDLSAHAGKESPNKDRRTFASHFYTC